MGLETPAVGLQVQPLESRSNFNPIGATAAMIEAFRNGQISTADIIERSTKMPALRQQVAEATDPALIAARKNTALQNSEQETIATQANQFALKQAQDLAKIPPTIRAKVDELAKHGALDPNFSAASYDDNQKAIIEARWNDLQQWKTEAESAAALAKQVEAQPGYDPTTGNPVPIVASGKIVNAQALESLQKYGATYGTPTSFNNWLKDGKPKAHRDLFRAPAGEVVNTPATPDAPQGKVWQFPEGAPTRAAAANLAVTLPPGTSNLTVTAKDNGPRIAAPNAPGYAVGKPTPEPSTKQNTEKQASAQYFGARAATANKILDELGKKNFDPTTGWNWLQKTLLRGPLEGFKDQDLKDFELAKQGWLQGLLRMESGAAISRHEESWYDQVFFPNLGDGPSVRAHKAELRKAVEETAEQIAGNSQLGKGALDVLDKDLELFRKQYVSGDLVGTPANTARSSSAGQTIQRKGKPVNAVVYNGEWFVPKDTGQSTNSAAPLTVTGKPVK